MSQTYKKLFSGNAIDVDRVFNSLSTIEIVPVIKDQAESARLAGFGAFYTDKELWVHQDEFNKAQELFNTLEL